MLTKKQRKEAQFKQYAEKWGLLNYNFIAAYQKDIIIYSTKNPSIQVWASRRGEQIKSLDTLTNRLKSAQNIILYDHDGHEFRFENIEEFKQHMLINKFVF